MEESQFGSSTRGQSADIYHRQLPRNIHPGNGVIYNFGPLGLLDTDQRACPYILDWYYTYLLPHSDREEDSSPHLDGASPEPGEDIWPPPSKPLTEAEEEQIWDSNLYERARSHLEASTSSAFFRRATFKHQDREQNSTSCHWWALSSARPTGPEDSFLEPPRFGNHYESGLYSSHQSDWALTSARQTGPQDSFLEPTIFGNHYTRGHHSSDHSDDVLEGSVELDQSNTRSNSSWRSAQALSKTGYMDDDFDIEQGLGSHFADVPQKGEVDDGHGVADIYSSTPASLPVRIIPRSSDPV